MQQAEFDREITRLRNHFGERHYSNELVGVFWKEFGSMNLQHFRDIVLEAISTRSQAKAPLRDDFRSIAQTLGINAIAARSWQHYEVSDCMTCGGCGWHYINRADGGRAVCACDDCAAGKNMQRAPKPTINFTMKKVPGATYAGPGRRA